MNTIPALGKNFAINHSSKYVRNWAQYLYFLLINSSPLLIFSKSTYSPSSIFLQNLSLSIIPRLLIFSNLQLSLDNSSCNHFTNPDVPLPTHRKPSSRFQFFSPNFYSTLEYWLHQPSSEPSPIHLLLSHNINECNAAYDY